jgi:hypothetical protein
MALHLAQTFAAQLHVLPGGFLQLIRDFGLNAFFLLLDPVAIFVCQPATQFQTGVIP